MADPAQNQAAAGEAGPPAVTPETSAPEVKTEELKPEPAVEKVPDAAPQAPKEEAKELPQPESQPETQTKLEENNAPSVESNAAPNVENNTVASNETVVPPSTESKETVVPLNAESKETVVPPSSESKETVVPPSAESNNAPSERSNETPAESKGDWQPREAQLLKIIQDLETVKTERSEDGLKLELKVREEEIELLKARVRNLETELQAALSKPSGKNHEMIEKIKQQHEELLSKARGMIFDKTKMVKNQELQIEALTTQVQSLKDINVITKDLLEIRNSEVKAMEERLQAMEARFKAEKERYGLVLKRAQTSSNINDDLRKEYETQLAIFKELREKYELRVQALVAENARLKDLVPSRAAANQPGAGGSGETGGTSG